MAQRKTLSEKQLAVLRWVNEGCPAGVMEGDSCRISAAALRRRGFVTTTGRGPTWSAAITDAGRQYLKKSEGPNAPVPRQANGSVTEQLVRDIVAAGGSLHLRTSGGFRGGVDYRQRAALAERYGKVPPGKRLVVHKASYSEIRIDLVDAPEGTWPDLRPVSVPARVARYHPVVAVFRDNAGAFAISRAALPRAARILHGLVIEAEQRGYRVTAPQPVKASARYPPRHEETPDGVAVITVDGHSSTVTVAEEGLPNRGHWASTNGSFVPSRAGIRERRPAPRSAYEAGATGRLTFSLAGYAQSGRPGTWSDRKRWTLEDKLPELLREVEVRAAEARHRRLEEERKAAERKRAWEEAMAKARSEFVNHGRSQALLDQVTRWRQAEEVRAYCCAAETDHPDCEETGEWVAWARRYSDRIDPLRSPPRMPADPEEVSAEDLRPFLGRWSPYGPDARY